MKLNKLPETGHVYQVPHYRYGIREDVALQKRKVACVCVFLRIEKISALPTCDSSLQELVHVNK